MAETSEKEIINDIEERLKKLDLKESDFQKEDKTPGVKAPGHDKVVNVIRDYWDEKHPFIPVYSAHGIDYVGRKTSQGLIELAVEVDSSSWRVRDSCMKLADIRAKDKIWIYVTNSETAEENFEDALRDIDIILRIRNEPKETFGNFVAFLKTRNPKDFKKVIIC